MFVDALASSSSGNDDAGCRIQWLVPGFVGQLRISECTLRGRSQGGGFGADSVRAGTVTTGRWRWKKQTSVPGCAKVSRDAACLASMQMLVGKLSSRWGGLWMRLDAFGE